MCYNKRQEIKHISWCKLNQNAVHCAENVIEVLLMSSLNLHYVQKCQCKSENNDINTIKSNLDQILWAINWIKLFMYNKKYMNPVLNSSGMQQYDINLSPVLMDVNPNKAMSNLNNPKCKTEQSQMFADISDNTRPSLSNYFPLGQTFIFRCCC